MKLFKGRYRVGCTALLAVLACGVSSSNAYPEKAAATSVTVRLVSDYDTLDPALTASASTYQLLFALYDRLVGVTRSGKVVPELATSWTQTPSSVTLHIRRNATCDDGEKLTPTLIMNSLNRLGDPNTHARYAYRTFGTNGYTVSASDSHGTVTVRTAQPFSDLLVGLGQPWASIVCPPGLQNPGSMSTTPAGSGPYTLASASRGTSYTLVARKGYNWGPNGESTNAPGFPQTLTFQVVTDDTTAANELLSGGLDIAGIAGPDRSRLQHASGISEVNGVVNFGSYMLVMNQHAGTLGEDPNLRKAIYAAIDARGYMLAQSYGLGRVATDIMSPAVQCFDPKAAKHVTPYSPTNVAKILSADGWSQSGGGWTKNGQPLTIRILEQPSDNNGPDYLVSVLKAVGIDASVQVLPFSAYLAAEAAGNWDLTVLQFAPPMPSLNTFTTFGTWPSTGNNFAGINNPNYQAAVTFALSSGSKTRCSYWYKAQEALLDANNVKPLENPVTLWFGRHFKFQPLTTFAIDPLSIRAVTK